LRSICAAASLALLAGFAAPARADMQSLLTVDKIVLTDSIDNASGQFRREIFSPVPRRRVWVWMQVRGTPDLLEKLRVSNGKLIVHHIWRKYVLTGVETRFDQPLEIGRAEDIDKLAAQVATDGYFTWHTWSTKMQLSRGNWRVDLEYEDHEPVMCQAEGEEPHACFYSFEVR
jgi:hypothetical protein